MKNHEGTPNPAAGAAVPMEDKFQADRAIRETIHVLLPNLDKLAPRKRCRVETRIVNHVLERLDMTPKFDGSRDRNDAYNEIMKGTRDRNRQKDPDPAEEAVKEADPEETSEKTIKVPALEAVDRKKTKLVYICGPFWAQDEEDRQRKLKKMESLSWFACTQGMIPVAPHLMYPAFLRDEDENENCYGFFCSMRLLSLCDEVWVMEDFGITEEMKFELEAARKFGCPIHYCSQRKS